MGTIIEPRSGGTLATQGLKALPSGSALNQRLSDQGNHGLTGMARIRQRRQPRVVRSHLDQPRSGEICVSRGREPAVRVGTIIEPRSGGTVPTQSLKALPSGSALNQRLSDQGDDGFTAMAGKTEAIAMSCRSIYAMCRARRKTPTRTSLVSLP